MKDTWRKVMTLVKFSSLRLRHLKPTNISLRREDQRNLYWKVKMVKRLIFVRWYLGLTIEPMI